MANTYKVKDEKAWDRVMHCMVFRNSAEPASGKMQTNILGKHAD